MRYGSCKFDRMEFAGSLGDLGTLAPLAIGMIVINGLDPTGVLFMIGIFYILAGLYYGVTVPVQPMKVIGAYVIATGMTPVEISASSLIMGVLLILLGITGAIHVVAKYTPRSVVRGVQLAVGTVLMVRGIDFMLGPEPYLTVQSIGSIDIGIFLGVMGGIVTLALLNNRRIPAAIVVVLGGMVLGLLAGNSIPREGIVLGIYLPRILPYGIPSEADFVLALSLLVIPQIPMTVGNAIISNADLTREYFGPKAKMTSFKALANSQGLANIGSFIFGGIPMCHGAGGLAAHYRFGARTAGSNILIGALILGLALFFGPSAVPILHLLPLSLLGVLLVFAGTQLCLMVRDVKKKNDFFVMVLMLGISLATNLGVAFIAGVIIAYVFKSDKLKI
jgi:SulP family sulfate permease